MSGSGDNGSPGRASMLVAAWRLARSLDAATWDRHRFVAKARQADERSALAAARSAHKHQRRMQTEQQRADLRDYKARRGNDLSAFRAAQKRDADAWRRLAVDPALRFARWAAVIGFFVGYWALNGTPQSVVGWIPVFIVAALAFLPDAASVSLFGVTWKATQAADRAERASEKTERIADSVRAGKDAGDVTAESAQSREAPKSDAGQALGDLL